MKCINKDIPEEKALRILSAKCRSASSTPYFIKHVGVVSGKTAIIKADSVGIRNPPVQGHDV
ncbi:MAG TPA: hypothetical protein ENL38_01680 [Candidatus Aminicenantes bacterium]|nr:hypothetical protein [Candidatus Aminicenantes bacterium]